MHMKNFNQEFERKILILDGAMGTMLQQKGLTAEDFGGPEQDGCNEILNLTQPELVLSIHEAYLAAGADIIETNSFGATQVVLREYNLEEKDIELNRASAALARKAADRWSTPDKPRFVAGSMGPTTKMLALTGGIDFAELEEAYYRQAKGLLEGGADLLLIETCQDTLNVKAAGSGIIRASKQLGKEVPIMVSCTIEPAGTMLAGQNIEAFYTSIRHLNPVAVGLNCGMGAELMNDHIRTLDGIASCAVSCYPNAGLPDEEGIYRETPEEFAQKMKKYAENGWLNIAGGCCGTTDAHIRVLADALAGTKPRKKRAQTGSSVSGIEAVWPEEENRPLLVGERSNVIGSRKFKDLIMEGRFEEGSEIARAQVKKGAQIIDICVANPDRDELKDMIDFLPHVVNKVKAPIMLDSTDPRVLEAGLRLIQGKAIINSINLENGLERFEEVVPLIRKYGAAVVVGVIDEKGMALTRERKLAVAERSHDLLVRQYGLDPRDIIFDPLTFPVGTGDIKYLGSVAETVEGLRLIKQKMPECKTILGISNVSFGLPAAGREVLNAVFVYMNTLAGLDYAIVNAEKLERYASIPSEEKKLTEELLLNTNDNTLKAFTDFYREKKVTAKKQLPSRSLEERLAEYIVEGSKDGLENDLKEGLTRYTPLELINGPLMKGMEEVGSLFNQNQLIVAEVLQSAEVMKAAVIFLEPYMEKQEQAVKGKILLATVKGDVHDIGKNLVEIILSNNGYQVINLGVKVSSEQLIEASIREKPDVIGLSGLLVKSVQQMLLTAEDLSDAGINTPLILGGAALSRKFTEEKIAPVYKGKVLYAKDAMDSLGLLHDLLKKTEYNQQKDAVAEKVIEIGNDAGKKEIEVIFRHQGPSPLVSWDIPSYQPVRLERQLLLNYPLEEIISTIHIPRLMNRYLGASKKVGKFKDKSAEFEKEARDFLGEIREKELIRANAVYGFFPVCSEGNSIFVHDLGNSKKVMTEFVFPRQPRENGLCLADFIRPLDSGKTDYLGMFMLTTGLGIREKAALFQDKGQYLHAILLQVLALELAEAFAEHLHGIMRRIWGIADQGIRVSLGYPVCPSLEDQGKIFSLLKPQEAGIVLTENFMMDPEASVSALVFSHPQARIFSLR
ncbi:MAG: Methionine synthase [Candidatus Dichloromethanomonas elyunquensis]|nr:MAG: Methionine synthase [Candidatus Dichloromethanomonas elyunquensis]